MSGAVGRLFRRHTHEWGVIAARGVDVYGDDWGAETKRPIRRYTDLSSICQTCGAPLFRRVEGDWNAPTTNPSERGERDE